MPSSTHLTKVSITAKYGMPQSGSWVSPASIIVSTTLVPVWRVHALPLRGVVGGGGRVRVDRRVVCLWDHPGV